MGRVQSQFTNVVDAIRAINAIVQTVRQEGLDLLGADVGAHLYPGDVYDAYQELGFKPVTENVLDGHMSGPFAAVFLHRFPDEDRNSWKHYVKMTFHPDYLSGFQDGFQLSVPNLQGHVDGKDVHYLRGVYDGVMANAAVFD